jgi:hypothetical protein
LPFTLPVKFRQPGDSAALGMDYQLRGKLAFVTAGYYIVVAADLGAGGRAKGVGRGLSADGRQRICEESGDGGDRGEGGGRLYVFTLP